MHPVSRAAVARASNNNFHFMVFLPLLGVRTTDRFQKLSNIERVLLVLATGF
jgi:hypothetical protein